MRTTLTFAVLTLLPGLPAALAMAGWRRVRTTPSLVAAEALVLGVAWYLVLGTVLAQAQALGRVAVLVPTLLVALSLAWPAWRGRVVVEAPRLTPGGAAFTAVLVLAVVLRRDPHYFLYQIADFGEYVNRANAIAEGGPLIPWFTHGFGVTLALGTVALGPAWTVDVVPFLGVTIITTVVAIGAHVGIGPWPRLAVAMVMAVGVVPVWFSRFPASETLYALLLVGMLLQLVVAVRARHLASGVLAGAIAGLLMLTRGNAVLLVPILVVTLLAAAVVVRPPALRVVASFTASAVAAMFGAFVYNSRYSFDYFVEFQMNEFFPEVVRRQIDDLGGLSVAIPKGALVAGATAAVVVGALALNERLHRESTSAAGRLSTVVRWGLLPLVVVVAIVAPRWPLAHEGLVDVLSTYDLSVVLLAGLGVVAVVVAFASDHRPEVRVVLVPVVLTAATFVLLYAYRFPNPMSAAYFLYWDRHLWSEVFPLLMVIGLWGAAAFETGVRAVARRGRLPAVGAGVALAVVVGVTATSLVAAGELAREQRFLGDAYGQMAALREATTSAGELPIVYAGIEVDDVPEALDFPNTYRLFALPLAETFGAQVLNIPGLHPFGEDPRPSRREVAEVLRGRGHERGVVLEVVQPAGVGLRSGGPIELRDLRTVTMELPMLDDPRRRDPDGWEVVTVELAVREVRLVGS